MRVVVRVRSYGQQFARKRVRFFGGLEAKDFSVFLRAVAERKLATLGSGSLEQDEMNLPGPELNIFDRTRARRS